MLTTARVIYVISDLHLGGAAEPDKRGFRICTHEVELAAFIDSLTLLNNDSPRIELVINGDMVDFLAERTTETKSKWSAFHYPENSAIQILDRIVQRTALVFEALQRFLAKGHRLVILPGNHYIELNLPAVRNRLRQHVGAKYGGDYEFIGQGEAYRVGDVLIEHGNRLDEMNFVDYQALRILCGLLSRGQAVHDEFLFDPPAGSKLVANVMNDVKETYSFIDLLKPEAEAAFPVILALEPGKRAELLKIASALMEGKERRQEQLTRYNTNIGAREYEPQVKAPQPKRPDALEEILLRTVGRADFAMPPMKSGPTSTVREIGILDKARSFASLLFGSYDETNLLDALRAFQNTNSFDRSVETDPAYFKEANYLAYKPIRHVVFGHTHLAKQVPLKNGGFYFNSGAWADMLELPRDILDPTRTYGPLGELKLLVRDLVSNDFSRYILFRPTYVRFQQDAEGHSVTQELCDYPKEP